MVKAETVQIVVASLTLMIAVIGGLYVVSKIKSDDPLQDRHLLTRGHELPTLWIYLNDSEVNSRQWTGFEERSSRVINLPFLNLCYETCMKVNGIDYRIEVIGGLSDLAIRLGGWEHLPTPLQNPSALVKEPELNWIRAAVLAKWGGLWASPAIVWLRPMGTLPTNRVVLFGSDDEVTFVGAGGTYAPPLRVAWSPIPQHPIWVTWEQKVRARLEKRSGGAEFRRDEMSDSADALRQAEERGEPIDVRPMAELSRKGEAGRRIQLEDILATGQEELPFKLTGESVYLPIPWPELKERRIFGWFLRMSEEQILNSDLVISRLFRGVLDSK